MFEGDGFRLVAAGQGDAEAPDGHASIVVGVGNGVETVLAKDIAQAEATDAVWVALVKPDVNQVVKVGLAITEKSLIRVEVALTDFDGAIAIKELVHARTSFYRFAVFGRERI